MYMQHYATYPRIIQLHHNTPNGLHMWRIPPEIHGINNNTYLYNYITQFNNSQINPSVYPTAEGSAEPNRALMQSSEPNTQSSEPNRTRTRSSEPNTQSSEPSLAPSLPNRTVLHPQVFRSRIYVLGRVIRI